MQAPCGWGVAARPLSRPGGGGLRGAQPVREGGVALREGEVERRATVLPSGRVVSGSMLNPAPSWEQGYDSLIYGTKQDPVFKPNLNAGRPNNTKNRSDSQAPNGPIRLVTGPG